MQVLPWHPWLAPSGQRSEFLPGTATTILWLHSLTLTNGKHGELAWPLL